MATPRKTTRAKPRPKKTVPRAKKPGERDAGPLDPRAVALIAALRADPRHGRLMKEWLTVTEASAPWIVLAREAHRFVGG